MGVGVCVCVHVCVFAYYVCVYLWFHFVYVYIKPHAIEVFSYQQRNIGLANPVLIIGSVHSLVTIVLWVWLTYIMYMHHQLYLKFQDHPLSSGKCFSLQEVIEGNKWCKKERNKVVNEN